VTKYYLFKGGKTENLIYRRHHRIIKKPIPGPGDVPSPYRIKFNKWD
jgi:hypothetical protein